jgi:hypothetical protein
VQAPLAYLVVGVAAGVLVSLGMAVICARLKFPWLFRWPQAGK